MRQIDSHKLEARFRLPLVALGFALCVAQVAHTQSPSDSDVVFAEPNGSVLALGESCYTITSPKDGKEQPIGYTFQSLTSDHLEGVDVLTVVVHQHLVTSKFDLRDRLVLRKTDLTPLHLDTDRDGAPHVHLDYAANRVTGWKMVNGAKQPVDVAFDGRVWDGNLWGVTFAALPLRIGGSYRLPVYQYDDGIGNFLVTVTEQHQVTTPNGIVDAWVVDAGRKPDERVKYLIGKAPRTELGYLAGPMSQHLGGSCGDLR